MLRPSRGARHAFALAAGGGTLSQREDLMFRDTIQAVPDNLGALGVEQHRFRYNNVDFSLEVVAWPKTCTTNDNAIRRMAQNIEINIRRSQKGLGLGQYVDPKDLRELQNGEIRLTTLVGGKRFSVPIIATPDGQFYCTATPGRRANSVRDMVARVMNGIFDHVGLSQGPIASRALADQQSSAMRI